MPDPNQAVVEEFRKRGGVVGGPFAGARLLLLTTTGARTGLSRISPLTYFPDGDRTLVAASNAGGSTHPLWHRNLTIDPRVGVELGSERWTGIAVDLKGQERDREFARIAAEIHAYAAYQQGTDRVIPVVALYREDARAAALSRELTRVHRMLRSDVASVLRDLDRGADSDVTPRLAVHCLAFCVSTHEHHTGETTLAFPEIERRHPHLRPALDRLRREHDAVARRLGEVRAGLVGSGDRVQLRAELRRLGDELEAHFAYEEEQLGPVLDSLPDQIRAIVGEADGGAIDPSAS